jgi:hypothetical protein
MSRARGELQSLNLLISTNERHNFTQENLMMKSLINRPFGHLIIVLLFYTALASAQDWPQYLGPERNSTSPQKNLLRSWPENGPEVLWTVEVGEGYGGPVVKDGLVYLLDRVENESEYLRCFDLYTGEELWNYSYPAPGRVSFPGSRTVPAIEGNLVYSCGHNGDLYCIDIRTREPVWKANIWTDFGGKPIAVTGRVPFGPRPGGRFPIWAISQCPLIYKDLLIIASQAPDAGVVAYDKLTGKLKWKTDSLGYVGYVSPSMVKVDGNDHVVMVTPSTNPYRKSSPDENILGKIVGIDPSDGNILWEYDRWHCHIPVPSAVDAGANKVLVVGGYELGAVMLRIEKQADGTFGTTELIRTEEFGDHTKPPILHEDYFYAQYGTNNTRDGLTCMSMEGEIMWKTKRDPDFNKGSMILADGLILATDGAKKLYLIAPDPAEFKMLASSEMLQAGQNWAPMALADGRLLIRDRNSLLCVRVAE